MIHVKIQVGIYYSHSICIQSKSEWQLQGLRSLAHRPCHEQFCTKLSLACTFEQLKCSKLKSILIFFAETSSVDLVTLYDHLNSNTKCPTTARKRELLWFGLVSPPSSFSNLQTDLEGLQFITVHNCFFFFLKHFWLCTGVWWNFLCKFEWER